MQTIWCNPLGGGQVFRSRNLVFYFIIGGALRAPVEVRDSITLHEAEAAAVAVAVGETVVAAAQAASCVSTSITFILN